LNHHPALSRLFEILNGRFPLLVENAEGPFAAFCIGICLGESAAMVVKFGFRFGQANRA